MNEKAQIRKLILQKRDALPKRERAAASHKIAERVFATSEYENAKHILVFKSFGSEVDTDPIIEHALADGKNVYLPRVEGRDMQFYRYDLHTLLEKSAYGIEEPPAIEPFEGTNALVIMPGAAFSLKKDRIGYGGGYYDRYFEKKPGCYLLAVAFDLQILQELPVERHDLKPHQILTELREV